MKDFEGLCEENGMVLKVFEGIWRVLKVCVNSFERF